MTDYQFESILEMIDMVLDGCKDIKEAKKKLERLKRKGQRNNDTSESQDGGEET